MEGESADVLQRRSRTAVRSRFSVSTICLADSTERPYYTLLLPLRYPPASDGWRYPFHPAATREVPGVVVGDDGDELTDDEGGGGGFWVDGEEARIVYG